MAFKLKKTDISGDKVLVMTKGELRQVRDALRKIAKRVEKTNEVSDLWKIIDATNDYLQ